MADFYAVLQVARDADAAAIAAAYQRLRVAYDPERLQDVSEELQTLAAERLLELERAYVILSDETLRAAYDAGVHGVVERALPRPVEVEPILDYRPLPPAQSEERARDFDSMPVSRGRGGRPQVSQQVSLILTIVIPLAIVLTTFILTDGGQRVAESNDTPPVVMTNALDQFEAAIDTARLATEENPNSISAWLEYGNMLYNSVQIVREQQPGSPTYQSRVARWQMAAVAYEKALSFDPGNPVIEADLGATQCFYGNETGDQSLATQGLQQLRGVVEQIDDAEKPRVLLNLGYCLAESSPPRLEEAVAVWQRVKTIVTADSPYLAQVDRLISLAER